MQTKNQISLTRTTLYAIMLFGLFFSAFGAGNLPSARAQGGATITPTPEVKVQETITPIPEVGAQENIIPIPEVQAQAEQENIQPVPHNDQFSGLPFHLIGETVETGGYIVMLENILLNSDMIKVTANLTNNTERAIELSSALNLYTPDGLRISPENTEGMLDSGNSLQKDFVYTLPAPLVQEDVMDYRLLYTPFGWSGPVIVYLPVTSLPNVSPPPTPSEQDIPQPDTPSDDVMSQAYNGITGDPWKMLILIYPNIDTDYVENGQTKRLTASMPAADIAAMKADFVNNQPHQKNIYDYSGYTAEAEAHVIIVNQPLTNLEPDGWGGFWPSPATTHTDLDLYAPNGKYDSVIIFWQASNPSTGQSLPVGGWGLGYWPGDYANGMTYATVFNISWVWPNDTCKGEVFLHEWLHGVTGFYKDHLGFPFNFEDLHGAEEAGYQWDYDQDGCWDMWLRDYMRGLVYENGQRKALIPATWQSGSITTHHINGWRGEYFGNETLSGIPVLVRDDPVINFDWQSDSPHPLVPADHFSARWTKTIPFNSGDHTFNLFRDDGIRLKIDGTTVLDAWYYGREWVSTTLSLTGGNHTIVVESYEIDGWASAIFQYKLPLTINKTGIGEGTVTSSPAGIDCGSDCVENYSYNTSVTLTATPAAGSVFTGWSGACTGTGSCIVAMMADKSVTANFTVNLNTSWYGSVSITADKNVVAVGRPHIGSEIASYSGFSAGAPTAYIPMLFKNAFGGTYDSALYIQNVDSSVNASVAIKYYDSSTGALTCTDTDTIKPLASKGYWLPTLSATECTGGTGSGLPVGWVGSAVVTSSTTAKIVANGRPHIGGEVMTYDSFQSGSLTSYLPMLFNGAYGGGYNSAFYIQNVSPTVTAAVTIKYYSSLTGALTCTDTATILPNTSKGYWLPTAKCLYAANPTPALLPAGWVGGVAVTSSAAPIVTVGRPHVGSQVTTYNGFAAGGLSSYVPMLFRKAYGGTYDSALYVQNVGAVDAAITIKYYKTDGTLTCTDMDTIAPLSSKGYWLPTLSASECTGGGLPDNWVGGVVVKSTSANIVAIGRPHIGSQVTTYNGFTSGNSNSYLPMLFKNIWGYDSAFYIQNTDAAVPASVTVKFYDADGNLSCVRSDSIPALSTLGYWAPNVTCAP